METEIKAETKHQEHPFFNTKNCTTIRYIENKNAKKEEVATNKVKEFGTILEKKIKQKYERAIKR